MSQKDKLKEKIEDLILEKFESFDHELTKGEFNVTSEDLTDKLIDIFENHTSELKKAIQDKISEFNMHAKSPKNQNDISKNIIKGVLTELDHLNQVVEFENLK